MSETAMGFDELSGSMYDTVARTIIQLYLNRDGHISSSLSVLLSEFEPISKPGHLRSKYSLKSSLKLFEILKKLHENVNRMDLKEYVTFLKVFTGYDRWISPNLAKNTFLICVDRMMPEVDTLLDFVRFVSEVVLEYDDKLPSGDSWIEEILKNDGSFGMSASLLIPLMLDDDEDVPPSRDINYERNSYGGSMTQRAFRHWLSTI